MSVNAPSPEPRAEMIGNRASRQPVRIADKPGWSANGVEDRQ